MIEVVRSRTIDAPREDVWSVLADFGGLARWAANADHSCLLDEPSSPEGSSEVTMVGVARRIQAGRYVLVERITVWEPPHRLAYTIAGMPPVMKHVVNEWRLDPAGESRARTTIVSLVTQVDCGPRPPQQLIARLAGRRLAKASDTMLAGLDDRCTRTGQAPTTDEATT